jgi:hypothetical protein
VLKKLVYFLALVNVQFSVLAQSMALDAFEPPMKSRTCGLIFLSEGRSLIRSQDMERGLVSLISAFALLQDGRKLSDKEAAREASTKLLTGSTETKTEAISKCEQWLNSRKTKSDFPNTEADRWNWVSQAQLTIQSEKN